MKKRNCLAGRDSDSGAGWIIGIAIALFVISIVVAICFYGGIFIGGFHSLKNYFLALKHNVWDSNRNPSAV